LDLLLPDVHDPALRHEIPESVEELGPDLLRPGGEAEVPRGVELDEVHVAPGVADAESGGDAPRLAADHGPGAGDVGPLAPVRALHQLLDGHRPGADPVGPPARVRYF